MSSELDQISEWYSSRVGAHARALQLSWEQLRELLPLGGSCLELGSADGGLTEHLLEDYASVTSVDGSEVACQRLIQRAGSKSSLRVICAMFEQLELEEEFDVIVLDHVIEHLSQPQHTLQRAHQWLKAGSGRLLCSVPNALSLHRLIGVQMGMLPTPDSLNELDLKLGHQRVYNPDTLRSELEKSGWKVERSGGVGLKTLSNNQIEQMLEQQIITPEYLEASHRVAPSLSLNCSEIYCVASSRPSL